MHVAQPRYSTFRTLDSNTHPTYSINFCYIFFCYYIYTPHHQKIYNFSDARCICVAQTQHQYKYEIMNKHRRITFLEMNECHRYESIDNRQLVKQHDCLECHRSGWSLKDLAPPGSINRKSAHPVAIFYELRCLLIHVGRVECCSRLSRLAL